MQLSLSPQLEKQIADRVNSGKYGSPEDVVAAALSALDQEESIGQFSPGELDALIDEGEQSGAPIDGKAFLAEWRALRNTAKGSSR